MVPFDQNDFNYFYKFLLWSGVSAVLFSGVQTFMEILLPGVYKKMRCSLGPVLIALSWLERSKNTLLSPFSVFGRVLLFYYVLHFLPYRITALIVYMIKMNVSSRWGFGITIVYPVWMSIVLAYTRCVRNTMNIKASIRTGGLVTCKLSCLLLD